MSQPHADSLVIFGATGDLAYQQIFPALHSMERHGHLDIPVIWRRPARADLESLRARIRQSIADHGGVDDSVFDRLAARVQYVAGEYHDAATFDSLRQALGNRERPVFYLAIPISLFETVVSGLARAGCAPNARVIVEKPFGRSLASAMALNATIHQSFPEPSMYRIDHFLGKEPVQNLLYLSLRQRIPPADLEQRLRGQLPDHCSGVIRRARTRAFLRGGRRYSRRVPESPLADSDAARHGAAGGKRWRRDRRGQGCAARGRQAASSERRRARAVSGVPERSGRRAPIARRNVRRGAPRDRQPPVAGVPFLIRSGEVSRRHGDRGERQAQKAGLRTLRLDVVALTESVQLPSESGRLHFLDRPGEKPGDAMVGDDVRLVEHHQVGDEMKAHERLFGDALRGDRTLFASQAGVEAAWRIVDPVLDAADQPL